MAETAIRRRSRDASSIAARTSRMNCVSVPARKPSPLRIVLRQRPRIATVGPHEAVNQRRLVFHQRRASVVQQAHPVNRPFGHLAQQRHHECAHFRIAVGNARRSVALPVLAVELRMPLKVRVAVVVVVQRRRVLKCGHAIARMKLHADRVRLLQRHVERVDALLAKYAPALGVQAIAAAAIVLQPVQRVPPPDGAEVRQLIAAACLPVHPRKVTLVVLLDLAPHVVRRREAE